MKKQYVIAMLLLIGLGVVSTMAFTLNAIGTDVIPKAYSVDTTQTTGNITAVRITPFLNADGIVLKVTLQKGDATQLDFDFDDGSAMLDLSSGYVFAFKDTNDNTTYTSTGIVTTDAADGHIEVPLTSGDATIWLKITGTAIYTDIEGLILSLE